MNFFARAVGLFLVALAAACSEKPALPPIQHAAPTAFDIPTGRVALAPITVDLPPRRGIGTYFRNVDCWVRIRSIMPQDMPSSSYLTDEVGQTLTAAKLQVTLASAPSVAAAGSADYLLVASVPSAHADACVDNIFNKGPADVDAQVALSWKLWSVKDNRVVYETTTTGTARASDPAQTINTGIFAAADDATRQLLGSSAAQQYLTFGRVVLPVTPGGSDNPAPVPTGGAAPIPQPPADLKLMPLAAPSLAPILISIQTIRPATAKIVGTDVKAATAKLGDSGAAIELGDGYLLTASTLVQSIASIPVTLDSGQSSEAKMVRRDDATGVALLRVGADLPPGLPIQPRRNTVGDRAYGLGGNGLVEGTFTATRSSGGRDVVNFRDVAPGGPVLDAAGNIIGILLPDNGFVSIGTAFKMLQLGVQPSAE